MICMIRKALFGVSFQNLLRVRIWVDRLFPWLSCLCRCFVACTYGKASSLRFPKFLEDSDLGWRIVFPCLLWFCLCFFPVHSKRALRCAFQNLLRIQTWVDRLFPWLLWLWLCRCLFPVIYVSRDRRCVSRWSVPAVRRRFSSSVTERRPISACPGAAVSIIRTYLYDICFCFVKGPPVSRLSF